MKKFNSKWDCQADCDYAKSCKKKKKIIIIIKQKGPEYATITNRSQPSTPRGREKGQKHTRAKKEKKKKQTKAKKKKKTNVREAQRPALSSPSEVIRILKQTETRGQRARED